MHGWLDLVNIEMVANTRKENFMRYKIGILECSRPEHEIDVFGMEYVIKKALYLRWTENVRVCIYKGIEVPLTLTPYEVLWKLAENVYKAHIVCPIDKESGTATEYERHVIYEIRKAFRKAGVKEDLIIKEEFGYRINLLVIPADYVITSRK